MYKKFKARLELWNVWRETDCTGRVNQLLVLLGIRRSITFEMVAPMKLFARKLNASIAELEKDIKETMAK